MKYTFVAAVPMDRQLSGFAKPLAFVKCLTAVTMTGFRPACGTRIETVRCPAPPTSREDFPFSWFLGLLYVAVGR